MGTYHEDLWATKIIVNIGDGQKEICRDVVSKEEEYGEGLVEEYLLRRLYRLKKMVEERLEKRGIAGRYDLGISEVRRIEDDNTRHESFMLTATTMVGEWGNTSTWVLAYTEYEYVGKK